MLTIPHICPFCYTATLFRFEKIHQKVRKCVTNSLNWSKWAKIPHSQCKKVRRLKKSTNRWRWRWWLIWAMMLTDEMKSKYKHVSSLSDTLHYRIPLKVGQTHRFPIMKSIWHHKGPHCKYNYHQRRRHIIGIFCVQISIFQSETYSARFMKCWDRAYLVCEWFMYSVFNSIPPCSEVFNCIQYCIFLAPLPAAAGPLARTKEWRCRRLHSRTKRLPKCHGHYSAYILYLFDICNTDRVFDSPPWMG